MTSPSERQPRVAFLLGKPVRSATVLAEVLDHLRAIPLSVTVHLPKGDAPPPCSLFEAELVVQRGLGLLELASALRLEAAGVRCCNRIAATLAVGDRARMMEQLTDAGLPVPATASAATWPDVLQLADGQPAVVKVADGSIGRGLGVLIAAAGALPTRAPFAGPYVVQEYIRGDQRDYKVYVVGHHATGLLKRRPTPETVIEPIVPFTVDTELAALSRLVGTTVDLEIYGVDFLYGANGPAVVDVNPFPGFRGVPEAASLIAHYLTAIATGHDPE